MSQSDYARTDLVLDALIPLDQLRDALGVTDRALRRKLVGVERHRYGGAGDGPGRQKAVRFGDVMHLFPNL